MRNSISFFVFPLFITLLGLSVQTARAQGIGESEKSPNVIMIMSDDQGWGDVGFNGNEVIQTPNLDAMATEGVRFERFYASAPLLSLIHI